MLAPPELTLATGLLEYPAADVRDDPRLFGDVNELARRNETALGMLPPE